MDYSHITLIIIIALLFIWHRLRLRYNRFTRQQMQERLDIYCRVIALQKAEIGVYRARAEYNILDADRLEEK